MFQTIRAGIGLVALCVAVVSAPVWAEDTESGAVQHHDQLTPSPRQDRSKQHIMETAREQYVRNQEAWLGDVLKKGGWRPEMIPSLSQASQGSQLKGALPLQDLQTLLTNAHVDVPEQQAKHFDTKWNDVNMVDEITRLLVHIQNSATNSVNYYTHRLTVENIQGDIFISLYNVHQEFCHRLMNYEHYDPVIAYGVGFPQRQPVLDFCQDGDNVVVWKVPEYHNLLKKDFMQQIARK